MATTLIPTSLAPTTPAPDDVTIVAAPIEITFDIRSLLHVFPSATRDTTLDQEFKSDPIEIEFSIEGKIKDKRIYAGSIEVIFSIIGELSIGKVLGSGLIEIIISQHGEIIAQSGRCNFVKWSKIGDLDFTIDESNVAGERPVDWKGCVYTILKLDNVVVVYGENGVTIFRPSGVHYGIQTIHRLGLVGLNAVAGNDFEHFFIDISSKLYKNSKSGLEKLDYSEYLSLLTDPVLSLDSENRILYICDGIYGFVYGIDTGSLGSGPVNISGIGKQGGVTYVTSPAAISTPKFEICTDIYDFGVRKMKTIKTLELGTDLINYLEAMVEYRIYNSDVFSTSPWKLVNPNGIAYTPCYGVEFRFRIRSSIYEYFELDYLKIKGIIHNYSYTDIG